MTPDRRIESLSPDQRASVESLKTRIQSWFDAHPSRQQAIQTVALFGSRAVGEADSEISDWDLYIIMSDDDELKGSTPADELSTHENCPTEWHRNSVTGYQNGLQRSSLDLASAVEKFGIPIFGELPVTNEIERTKPERIMNIDVLTGFLLGIVLVAKSVVIHIPDHLDGVAKGFPAHTSAGEPYDPELFKYSSNFAEHVAKLVIASKGITPKTIHKLEELAMQLEPNDPYRARIANLNGAKRDGNIAVYANPTPPANRAEDEPASRSLQRVIDAFRLLSDFLAQKASKVVLDSENSETLPALSSRLATWRRVVVAELAEISSQRSSDEWLKQLHRDSITIYELLDSVLQRLKLKQTET